MTDTNNTQTVPVEPGSVLFVYKGRARTCCCGCAGKYYYHPLHTEEGAKRLGYAIDARQVRIGMCRRVLKLFLENADAVEYVGTDTTTGAGSWSLELNGKLYMLSTVGGK